MCDVPNVDDADADELYLYRYLDRTICICIIAESFPLIAKTARRDPFYFTYCTASVASAWCDVPNVDNADGLYRYLDCTISALFA